MEKRVKTTGLLCVCLVAMMLIFSACGNNANEGEEDASETPKNTTSEENVSTPEEDVVSSTEEHVKLKMYFLGDKTPDTDIVFDEINKLMTEKINAEIEPAFLSWSDWEQKYPLLFASGEDFDMIYTANWAQYAETSAKGGFLEITEEMRNQYLPLVMANLPEAAWPGSEIKGKNYMVPGNNTFANHYGIGIRGDLREKYDLPEIKSIEDLEVYMDAVLANEPDMIPLDTSTTSSEELMRLLVIYNDEYSYLTGLGLSTLVYKHGETGELIIKSLTELPSYQGFIDRMVEWNTKGYFSKSDFTAPDAERFDSGRSAVKVNNIDGINSLYQVAKRENPDWKIEYINILEGKKLGMAGFTGNGTSVNAGSKNPERALMAIDLLAYDPEINFLVNHGIPDVHANLVSTEEIEGMKINYINSLSDQYVGFSTWGFANIKSFPLDTFEGYKGIAMDYSFEQISFHPLDGFSMNTENVKTEIATASSIITEYMPQLNLGVHEDAGKLLEIFHTELKAAGIEKINDEIRSQAQAIFDAAQ